jgi:hypothetical protein
MPKETYEACLKIAREYLRTHESIRNQSIRELAGINYDQAIAFFNLAVSENQLVRLGAGSSTRYVSTKPLKH